MKNRKKLIVICVALVALGASAASVDRSAAVYAARRWATSGAVLEKSLGQKVVSSETLTATNDVTLHAVRFDGGTAFVSSDTELEPIVAFTTSTNFSADANNRLWQLLKRDTIVRHNVLSAVKAANATSSKATAAATGTVATSAASSAAQTKWAKLLEGRSSGPSPLLGATVPNKLDGVSDVRVAPLVKSQWSQTTAKSHDCYNYYTPNHDPCGCTATAMSQIMRYHEYPKDAVTARSFLCTVDDAPTQLTMQGGTYDWSKMTLCPASSSYVEANWAAIGKLTSDVGIAIESDYTTSGTGSLVSRVAKALKDTFGYANGACIFNWDVATEAISGDGRVYSNVGLHSLAVREKVIYANLDAKCPVELGVYGYGDEQIGDTNYWEGHAIVGDGYGYSEYGGEQVPYVHINLGWHGLDDAWYNIPEIHSPNSGSYIGSEGTAFTVLSSAAYNLFPTNTGNIVSGRVYDDDGEPIAGATVTIRAAGSSGVIATRTTDAKGIYAFIVPGGKDYDITCDDPTSGLSDTHTVNVSRTTMECNDNYGVYTEKDANVGNYWGNDADFEMSVPCVRIVGGSLYLSLDKALAAAQDGDVLEILEPAFLKKAVALNASCTIVSTNDDPTATLVTRRNGAALAIAAGKTLTLSNVVFAADAVQPVIDVAEGATLKIAGTLGLGTVRTADAGGVDLCGSLALADGYDVSVDSPNSAKGGVFGTFSCDLTIANEKAKLIFNAHDLDLGGVADSSTGKLKWDVVTVPVESAKVVVDVGSGPIGYRTFAAALKALGGSSGTITIRTDIAHTNTVTLAQTLTLAAANDATLAFTENAGFVIPTGANLLLTNITVSGAGVKLGDCAFKVTGGDLTLACGTTLDSFSNTYQLKKPYGGAVVVTAGSVTMESGSLITNCVAHNGANGGGAIWIGGANSAANLLGGTITGCSAPFGGAVYACQKATVGVAGDFVAEGNTKLDGVTPGNFYLMPNCIFTLTDELTGSVGVSFGVTTPDLNATNVCFVASEGLSEEVKTASAPCFAHDISTNLVGACVDGQIVWAERPADDGQCGMSEARYAVVIDEGGANEEWRYYKWIEDAFEHLDCDATVYCAEGDWLGRDIEIRHAVRLVSFMPDYRGVQTIQRLDDAMVKIVKGGSLTLENIKFSGLSGYTDWYPYYYENNSSKGLFSVDGGSLTLEEGAVVGYVEGSASRASNAITVFNGGTVTMKSGSHVTEVDNVYMDDYETSCGGGILLDHATGRFEGGAIYNCKAYRAGGLYVANGSTAYISGDFYAYCNYSYKREYAGDDDTSDNIVVSKNSKLVLAGPLASVDPESEDPENPDQGYIGVNEGISSDSNCFATVDWEWTDFEALKEIAAQFAHDIRKLAEPVYDPEWEEWDYTVYGTAVTNGEGKAVLVWEDSLSQAKGITIDGQIYRSAIPAGMSVATPTAFSVTPTTGANGKQVLSLDGGVEGCWYTVYSTTDLNVPFTAEKSVQLKAGETFEFEVDQTSGAKFYKVVAEEGLR